MSYGLGDELRDALNENIRDTLTPRELAAVLAGLRKLQYEGYNEGDLDIATDEGQFKPLSESELDDLCMRLNFGD